MTSFIRPLRHATRLQAWVLALTLTCPSWATADHPSLSKPLVVGSELDFPPFALVREDGAADGFTVELWRAVARAAHLDGTIKTGPFHEILEQFKSRQIDVLINLAISDQRRSFADFSVRHVKMSGAVFTRKGDNRIKSEADLAQKSLIVVKADLAHDYVRLRGWSNIVPVETVAEGMKLLAGSSRHDAMLVGRLVGLNTTKDLRLDGIQALQLKVGFQQEFAFAVRKGNAELLAHINDGLANVHASGAYEEIYAKWFAGLEPQPLSMEAVVDYLVPVFVVILLLTLAYFRERSLRLRWKRTATALESSVAEREQVELDLRTSEARFKAFMDRSPAIAFIKDGGGRYIYVNKTWEHIYALDWRGKTDIEIWPRDDAAMFSESDRRALEASQASESFETVLDKDRNPQDWWVMKFPLVDGAGKRLLGGMAMDITERKAADAERARLASIVENSSDAIISHDLDFRVLTWNRAAQRMFGYTADQVIGRSTGEFLIPPDRAAEVKEKREGILRDGSIPPYDTVRLAHDGRRVDVSVTQSPIMDASGTVIAVSLAMRDISGRKRAERRERSRREVLEQLAKGATINSLLASIVGLVEQEVSDASCAVLLLDESGTKLRHAAGLRLPYVCDALANESSIGIDVEPFGTAVFTGQRVVVENIETSPFSTEWRARALEAGMRFCWSEPIISSSGQVLGTIETYRRVAQDSTPAEIEAVSVAANLACIAIERKRAEDALQMAHDELDKRVKQRTLELTETNALLRKQEQLLQQAIEVADLGIFEHDFITGKVSYSPAFKKMIDWPDDLPPSREEFRKRVHPDDRDAFVRSADQAQDPSGDGRFACECRIPHRDGSYRWLLIRAQMFFDDYGGVRRLLRNVGAVLDTTARKRAEDNLRETKNLLQTVMDSSPDWIFAKDLDFRFLFVNRAFAATQGLTPDEMIGRRDTEFWSEEFCEGNPAKGIRGFHHDDRAAFGGEIIHNPSDPATLSDGSVHTFDTFKSPMRDEAGQIFGVLCYCRDITERKQAEEALRQSEERLRSILDNSPAPVFIKDVTGRYLHVNGRFEELFGVSSDDVLGRNDLELFTEEQARSFQANDQAVLDLGSAIQFEELAHYRDGEHTSIVNKFPLRDADGNTYALCGIATDITERKAAETALRQLTEQLDRRVVERTQELADSQARLRALVAEITKTEERERRKLVVEMHDYLAQSLALVRINLGRAGKLAADEPLKKQLAEAQQSVDESIAYTRSLIAQLSPRVLYEVGLPAALNWLAAQQQERHGLKVEIRGEAQGLVLNEEESVLAYQCVRELLWNVVKHAQANRVVVSYAVKRGGVIIEVADDGVGFDPASLQGKVNDLEQFGLFNIRERLELVGGTLEVRARPGPGASVQFTMPVAQTDAPPTTTREKVVVSASRATGAKLRVALVDDHAVVRRGLRQLLEDCADLTVVGEGKDGLESVELARQYRPDVIVMDVNMPGMNGIEATKVITEELPSTAVVGLSFDSSDQVAQAMKAAGAFACVTKERAVEDIHRAILDAVAARRTAIIQNQ